MSITLAPIQYYSPLDPYHYTIDNRPLEDLAANDEVLAAAIDALTINNNTISRVGDWPGMILSIPMNQERGQPFAYIVKVWAISDRTSLTPQNSKLQQFSILGSSDISGNVHIENQTTVFTNSAGAALTIALTGDSDRILVTFSGYAGGNGYVLITTERFGF